MGGERARRRCEGERGRDDCSQLHEKENMLGRVQTERLSANARRVLWLILIFTALRLVLAWSLGLGVDESYEVVMARVPSLSYFDHPPLSFWMAGGTARITGTEHRAVVRLPFILLFAVTSWLMFRLTARYYGDRAAYLAVLLLNVTPVFSLSTGGWVLPDGPLGCALLAAALCLSRVLIDDTASPWWWLGAGVTTGAAVLSKYHGVFLLAGAFLFLVTRRESRHWLRRREPYVAAIVALLIATPVLIWNLRHGFASLRFQAGRATTHGVHFIALAQNILGQLGYLLPWIGVPLLWQLGRGLRSGPRDAPRWLLTCLAIGPIGVFTLISLGGNPGLPHWPAPGYVFLFPLLGDAIVRSERRGADERLLIGRVVVACVVAFFVLTIAAASAIATGWPGRLAPSLFRRGDPTLEAVDWRELKPSLEQRGMLKTDVAIVTTHWIDAAKAGYALGPAYQIYCFSDDPRGFRFTFPAERARGREAVLLLRAPRADVGRYRAYFDSVGAATVVPIERAGRVVLELEVFHVGRVVAIPSYRR